MEVLNGNGTLTEKTPKIVNKNDSKKKKKKKKKKRNQKKDDTESAETTDMQEDVEIEYVSVNPLEELDQNDPNYQDFARIFDHFTPKDIPEGELEGKLSDDKVKSENSNEKLEEEKKISKKEKKRQKRVSIAVLKQLVKRPDVVEAWDVTSADPMLLVYLKACRNTVFVPRHWNQKRKYLQGKRGIEKPPFQLPEFIAATGISRIRTSIEDKMIQRNLKQNNVKRCNPNLEEWILTIRFYTMHSFDIKPNLN